jgi:hypothetical protein
MTSIKPTAMDDEMGPMAVTDRTPMPLGLVITIVLVVAGVLTAFASLSARVSVIEDAQRRNDARLARIEDKLDRLLEAKR